MDARKKASRGGTAQLDRPGDRIRFMLTVYLKTIEGLDPRDGAPVFSMPRSKEVDSLLRSLGSGGTTVDDLALALTRHHFSPISPDPAALREGWARQTARRIHAVIGLEPRLKAYIQALLERDGEAADGASPRLTGPEVTVEAEPPPPMPQAPRPARRPGTQSGIYRAHGRYFEQRLAEEVSRASRGNGFLSVLLVRVDGLEPYDEQQGEAVVSLILQGVRSTLREYDICNRTAGDTFSIILPEANHQDCAAVVARLRKRVAASLVGALPVQVHVGTATWPEDGSKPEQLVGWAAASLADDRRRQLRGEVALEGIPPSMVEGRRTDASYPASVLFEGFPQQVRVNAVQTPEGLRLRMPLKFLRIGSSIHFDLPEGSTTGVLTHAVLGRTSTGEHVPMLYLDVSTAPDRPH